MKKKIISPVAFVLITCSLMAQPEQNPGWRELQEKVIGWAPMMVANGNAPGKSLTVQERTYSAYQIGLMDLFTEWIKKSYIPIGGLAQPERIALPDSRENKLYLPKGTGVSMQLWSPCYNASGKGLTRAQPASCSRITILTNHIKGLEAASDYNTPGQYYFTMYYDKKGTLLNEEDAKTNAVYVNELKSKIGNYLCYFTGNTFNVILTPSRELPVIPVSIGEVLDKGEEAINRTYPDKNSFMNKSVMAGIKRLREKYKARLQEPAFVRTEQLSATHFEGNENDPFQRMVNSRYMFPVYRINPAFYELARQDKPQLIHISFPYATEKSRTVEWEIFKAMTQNFNYEYVYDYFFNPEKVKGKPYQPLKPVSQDGANATIDTRENKAKQSKTFPEGIHFMEDFADATSGAMPAGWTSKQNNRGFTIETPSGEKGKWLLMDSGADIIPSSIRKPLPQNFTLEFDLITTDYTNRAGRMVTVSFAGEASNLSLYITPGNEENIKIYPSIAGIRLSTPLQREPSYHSMEFSSYSNKKNKVHVKIVKSGTSVKAFVNGVQVKNDPKYKQDYDKEMQVSANLAFNSLEWKSDVLAKEENRGNIYISNIKLRKD